MGLFSEQDLATLAQTPPIPTQLPFWEGAGASLEAGLLSEHSLSTEYQLGEALRTSLSTMREYGMEALRIGYPATDVTADAGLAWLDSKADEIRARRAPENGPPDLRLQTGEEIRARVQADVARAQGEAERAGTAASLLGGAGVALSDPMNLALLPMGAAAGEGLLMRALTEAGLGAVSQAGVEVASLGAKARAGLEPTLEDAAGRVALTGALGAGFAGVLHGAGLLARRSAVLEAWRKLEAEGLAPKGRTFDDAARAVEDSMEAVRPQATPQAEAAFVDGLAAAGDALQAVTPEAEAAAVRRMAVSAEKTAEENAAATISPDRDIANTLMAAADRFGTNKNDNIATAIDAWKSVGVSARVLDKSDPSWIRAGIKSKGAAFHWTIPGGGEEIVINPYSDYWKDPAAFAAKHGESGFFSSTHPARTLVHEMGHSLYRVDAEKVLGLDVREMVRQEVGRYAAENPREFVAEVFTGLASGKTYSPRIMKLYDDFTEPSLRLRANTEIARQRRAAAIEARMQAVRENPRPLDTPFVATDPTPPPRLTTETDEAAFAAATEANPDLPAHYTDARGRVHEGRAADLVAKLDEDVSTARGILDCLLAGGPQEIAE